MCSFMPYRNKDNQEKFLPETPISLSSQPSFFFSEYELTSLTTGELENLLGEPANFFKKPIREEEPISPTQTMVENNQNELFL